VIKLYIFVIVGVAAITVVTRINYF